MADKDLVKLLSTANFDPDNYVQDLSRQTDGAAETFTSTRDQVQKLVDQTNLLLKKNVYKNYTLFIETAREISVLEGEMYQLSHLLTDQKDGLHLLLETSMTNDRLEIPRDDADAAINKGDDETKKNLAFLLEKVEGCAMVTEVAGRFLVHDGDLVQMDPDTFNTLRRVRAFLLNDSVMITTPLPKGKTKGPTRYKFESLYDLDSLAIVNAKDMGPVKNAFKVLMFPDCHLYQAESPKAKKEWLEMLDQTKKARLNFTNLSNLESKRRESMAIAEASTSQATTPVSDPANPFYEDYAAESAAGKSNIETSILEEDWVKELMEDLDVFIAERNFEDAVDSIEKAQDVLSGCPKTTEAQEYRSKIEQRVSLLTDVLMRELDPPSLDRSGPPIMQGGPRAARRAISQLTRLGKCSKACQLFLKGRSTLIKHSIRQLKIEGATTLYIKRLCAVFFPAVLDAGKEFFRAFPENNACTASFVVWARKELLAFYETYRRQVFAGGSSKSSFSAIAECVQVARSAVDSLHTIGLDLVCVLDSLSRKDIEKIIYIKRDHLLDAAQQRAREDLWRPMNHFNESMVLKFVGEMEVLGLGAAIKPLVYDECWVSLTQNTTQFAKSILGFVDAALKLYAIPLHPVISDAIKEVFQAQIDHAESSLKSQKFFNEYKFILKNAAFVLESVLPIVEATYLSASDGRPCGSLAGLKEELQRLRHVAASMQVTVV